MAEIRKENGKWMADGKELKLSGVQKLSDDELENVDGGIRIYTKSHWYGNEYLVCGNCGAKAGRSSARGNQMSFRFAAISAEEFRGKRSTPDPGPKTLL